MNKPINALMEKEVTRKEFLAMLGFGVASVLGFSNILNFLNGKHLENHTSHSSTVGYGSMPYGGGRDGKV